MNRLKWANFLNASANLGKLKVFLMIFWHLIHETLKSKAVYELSWFFLHAECDAKIFG